MAQFRDFLEEEGLPVNDDRMENRSLGFSLTM